MRKGLLTTCIVAALVAWPLLASAGTPTIDKDERALKKRAVDNTGGAGFVAKARGLCVCMENSGDATYEEKLGILVFERVEETIAAMFTRDMLEVRCRVFAYDQSTGERDMSTVCDTWVPLGK